MRLAFALAFAWLAFPVLAGTKTVSASGYGLPDDKPVTIVLMRPDTDVGQLMTGGLPQPNADWTKAARKNLTAALTEALKARQIGLRTSDMRLGYGSASDTGQMIADYTALHQAIATAIIEHKYNGSRLPTKKDRFDWTLGPGMQALGDMTGSNYALFLYTRDNFASTSRKATQVAGMLGCIVGFCMIVPGGQHIAYASLVELSSGNIVWFNVLRGSKGDVREKDGAQAMVDAIMASMPTRPGEAPKPDEVAGK